MSETILEHGYVPEEHAPDPVIGHGDPTPPGKIAIWLFLASEVMFFVAILGSYIVLRSGSPDRFAKHAEDLSKTMAGANTLVLIFSSLTMALAVDAAQKGKRTRTIVCLLLTLLMAGTFMGIKTIEYKGKFQHQTIVALDSSSPTGVAVFDGHVLHSDANNLTINGAKMPLTADQSFDIHWTGPADFPHNAKHEDFTIPVSSINQQISYGPWKNVFYACYFTLTGIHGLHVVGGMIPLFFLLVQSIRGKLFPAQTEYVGLYWHFVDLVWIFLFPLMYLI